jgi:hypothetical protein
LTYGNNHTASAQYNSRLLPTSYSLSNAMTRSYSYFADGRLSTSALAEDGSFNRAYEYDHAGRLKSDTTPSNFAQDLTYDVGAAGSGNQYTHYNMAQAAYNAAMANPALKKEVQRHGIKGPRETQGRFVEADDRYNSSVFESIIQLGWPKTTEIDLV